MLIDADVLREHALRSKRAIPGHSSEPYLSTLTSIFPLMASNQVPDDIKPHLSACRFIASHKDPDDLTQLRPIGIGSSFRRFFEAILALLFKADFAELFAAQGQMAVGIRGGMEFPHHIAHARGWSCTRRPNVSHPCVHRHPGPSR